MIEIDGFSTNRHLAEYQKAFADVTPVSDPQHRIAESFVLVFREHLRANLLGSGPLRTNRTHCTYCIAISMREAAHVYGLDCLYESHGRLDGVIQTSEEDPVPVVVAEWEWNSLDIFGDGKELDKLWHAVTTHKGADALLITYCEKSDYLAFARKVIVYWQSKYKRNKEVALYFVTIVYRLIEIDRSPVCLRTLQISSAGVELWDDVASEQE